MNAQSEQLAEQMPGGYSLPLPSGDQADGLQGLARKSQRPLRVIALTSGKGGVGKTCVSVNLAVTAARMGQRVLLIDADLGLANVEILLGISPRYHVGDLLDGVNVHEVLASGPHGIRILAGGSGFANMTHIDDEQKQKIISALEPLEDTFDTVIIDCGAGIGENVVFFVGAANERVLVVNPEPTSLTDAYATIKVLSESGVSDVQVLVNQVATEQEARKVYKTLAQVADKHLTARVRYLGALPKDGAMAQAVMARQPAVDLFPRAPITRALTSVARDFLAGGPDTLMDGGLKFLWRRLLRESEQRG